MVERRRMHERHGLPTGMDDYNTLGRHAAGDAVVPQVAEWIARRLHSAILSS